MTWVRISEQADGDVWTVQLWRKIQADLNEGVMRPLATTTVGGGGAASIDITSISGDYETLIVVALLRDDNATATNSAWRFNADTGANYDSERTYSANTTITNDQFYAQTAILGPGIPHSGAPANVFGANTMIIPNYASTAVRKATLLEGHNKVANTSGNHNNGRAAGFWRSTAAITRITIFPTAGNLVEYSTATLYGVT